MTLKNKVCLIVDDDEVIHPNYIEKIRYSLEELGGDLVVSSYFYFYIH